MDHLLEFFYPEHDEYLLDIVIHILQAWLVVAPPLKFYTVSTVLFYKYGWANVAVTNCISHFSMFVPTKANVKLANVKTGNSQWIGIILCRFPKFSIIYPVGPAYYCPSHPYYNTQQQQQQQQQQLRGALDMSPVFFRKFHNGVGWDEHRKVWHEICDSNIFSSIFTKDHSR